MATKSRWLALARKSAGMVLITAALVMATLLIRVWTLPASGDIYRALLEHPAYYKLSLGHMADLTIPALAYLRLPLAAAAASFLLGGVAALLFSLERAYLAIALALVGFFQAARMALAVFDPYLSSYAVARELKRLPKGTVIVCGKYNPLSSVFFYSTDNALQNTEDLDILEYGSLAPGAPRISIGDGEMRRLWDGGGQVYIVAKRPKLKHVEDVLGTLASRQVFHSGDKYLVSNKKSGLNR